MSTPPPDHDKLDDVKSVSLAVVSPHARLPAPLRELDLNNPQNVKDAADWLDGAAERNQVVKARDWAAVRDEIERQWDALLPLPPPHGRAVRRLADAASEYSHGMDDRAKDLNLFTNVAGATAGAAFVAAATVDTAVTGGLFSGLVCSVLAVSSWYQSRRRASSARGARRVSRQLGLLCSEKEEKQP